VLVELDGEPWRTVPEEAVIRVGLTPGLELDRPLVRALARELRRARAVGIALRALRHRDLSERRLDERLARAGVPPTERARVLGTLERSAYVDDARFAASRARALAARSYGDAAIRDALEHEGIAEEALEAALAELEPELERAAAVVARRGAGPATARYLARRGFDDEVVESAVAQPER
jgi:SOS response regulatory protein OraA/RecX